LTLPGTTCSPFGDYELIAIAAGGNAGDGAVVDAEYLHQFYLVAAAANRCDLEPHVPSILHTEMTKAVSAGASKRKLNAWWHGRPGPSRGACASPHRFSWFRWFRWFQSHENSGDPPIESRKGMEPSSGSRWFRWVLARG
jgi:hypothetical protein